VNTWSKVHRRWGNFCIFFLNIHHFGEFLVVDLTRLSASVVSWISIFSAVMTLAVE